MKYVLDAHCHLAPDHHLPQLSTNVAIHIQGRILCGIRPAEWDAIARAADAWPGTIPAFGIHPWNSADATGPWLDRLRSFLLKYPRAWLGEIGLDYLKADPASIPAQQEIFVKQLQLARELGRPVNIHCLKAHDDIIQFLDAHYLNDGNRIPFIMHSPACPHQAIEALAARGAYFTVGPLFSRKDSERRQRRAAIIPDDRLLLESDAYVNPPVDAADDLLHTLHWLAAVRGAEAGALAGAVAANSRRIADYDG